VTVFESCHSLEPNPPLKGFYEDWAVCKDNNGYPISFMNGFPWARETFPTTTYYPGTWNTYEFSQPICELGVDEEFWAIVVILQDQWTPGGYNAVYYGYDTNSWYGRSYANLHGYYNWEPVYGR
jgi:hypothetical protein